VLYWTVLALVNYAVQYIVQLLLFMKVSLMQHRKFIRPTWNKRKIWKPKEYEISKSQLHYYDTTH